MQMRRLEDLGLLRVIDQLADGFTFDLVDDVRDRIEEMRVEAGLPSRIGELEASLQRAEAATKTVEAARLDLETRVGEDRRARAERRSAFANGVGRWVRWLARVALGLLYIGVVVVAGYFVSSNLPLAIVVGIVGVAVVLAALDWLLHIDGFVLAAAFEARMVKRVTAWLRVLRSGGVIRGSLRPADSLRAGRLPHRLSLGDYVPVKYVEWAQVVADAYASDPGGSHDLVGSGRVASRLGISPDDRARDDALTHALDDLRGVGALSFTDYAWIEPTAATWQIREGVRLQSGWPALVRGSLNAEREQVLAAAVRLSETRHDDWADMTSTTGQAVRDELGWSEDEHDIHLIAHDLEAAGLIELTAMAGGDASLHIRPTYAGVVRATERISTEWDARLREMVAEWETTTVEFKSRVELGTPARNAEFAKDIDSLANTKSSGSSRHLIVGYDPKTHEFAYPVDPAQLQQDRLEQILNQYAKPAHDIRSFTIEHESGKGLVGIIEVGRDPTKLPHRIAKAGGKVVADTIHVRHGSQVEPATPDEELALIAEGKAARGEV